ncbi:MAG: acetate--CoA ligase family protein, partial [Betaproteobacteria bacterium]|nr:acetate--CoA ligase family protein [Betaproteobacteria bacterium]
ARRRWQAEQQARAELARSVAELKRVLRLPPPQPAPAQGEGRGRGDASASATTSSALDTASAAALLTGCGVPLAPFAFARSAEEAVAGAQRLGYPVALKIESPGILHKTEAKGVKLALGSSEAVVAAFGEIMDNARRYQPAARIEGVLVQKMCEGEVELVVGLHHDAVFGVVVMVGLGGIHVEVLKDVVFRKAPVAEAEAGRMLDELRAGAILRGVRGSAPVDRAALTGLISALSRLGAAAEGRLKELDLNPVLAGPAGATAVDWLMVLDGQEAQRA